MGKSIDIRILRPSFSVPILLLLSLLPLGQSHAEPKANDLVGTKAPPILGDPWINSQPLRIEDLRGKVILIDIWEYTCVNCIRTLPYLKEWHQRYSKDGLVIIGVHTPEFQFSKELKNVKTAVEQFGIEYPVVLDNEYLTWNNYKNRYWPRKYLIDKNGVIRYDHIGEGSYDITERKIQELLHEINPSLVPLTPMDPIRDTDKPGAVCYPTTPELYLGFYRGKLGTSENYSPYEAANFKDPGNHEDGYIYLNGRWFSNSEFLRHAEKTDHLEDYIAIQYHALEVNLVIKPAEGGSFRVYAVQDGRPISPENRGGDLQVDETGQTYLEVREARMYQIIKNKEFGTHELKLASKSDEFGAYAFTFGSCEILEE